PDPSTLLRAGSRGHPSPHGLDEPQQTAWGPPPSAVLRGKASQSSDPEFVDDPTEFDPTAFDFGGGEFIHAGNSAPVDLKGETDSTEPDTTQAAELAPAIEGFRTAGEPANIAELLKFLIDRTGYIKIL